MKIILLTTLFILTQTNQIPPGIIDGAMNVNPYGLAVYGFLVAWMGIQWYLQKNTIEKKDQRIDELVDKSLTLMVKIEDRLPSIEKHNEIKNGVDDIKRMIDEIRRDKNVGDL